MKATEAAALVQSISNSLRAHPDQFQIVVNNVGFSAQNSGGVGYQANNVGGIGFNANMSGGSIRIFQNAAGAAVDQAMTSLLEKLEMLGAHLRDTTGDKQEVKSFADWIYAERWVPNVIVAVVESIVKALTI